LKSKVKVDEFFTPHPDLKKLYYSYLLIGSIIFYLSWAFPVSVYVILNSRLMTAIAATILIFLPFIFLNAFTAFWIPKFYSSLEYLLTENDIIIERGVWWKHKGIVPYNRVTNIDVVQGPLSRRLGLGKISIQTAGFSAGGSSGRGTVAYIANFTDSLNNRLTWWQIAEGL